jgi:hypothetical protein
VSEHDPDGQLTPPVPVTVPRPVTATLRTGSKVAATDTLDPHSSQSILTWQVVDVVVHPLRTSAVVL